MDVPITQFRREIFTLVNQAMEGRDVWITHKGRRFKIVPENPPADRLSRITPMEIINPATPDLLDPALKVEMMAEMETAWERDWKTL
jgi:prevent-host-death family protein